MVFPFFVVLAGLASLVVAGLASLVPLVCLFVFELFDFFEGLVNIIWLPQTDRRARDLFSFPNGLGVP